MNKFVAGALMMVLFALALLTMSNNVGNPALLSTAEYAINTEASLADRGAERLHNEEMARIEAARAETEAYYRTLRTFGTAAIVAVGLFCAALVFGATRRPQAPQRQLSAGREPDLWVIDPEVKRLERVERWRA